MKFSLSHSGTAAKRPGQESITTTQDYGFRARAFGAPRNDDRVCGYAGAN
jgi:hypothetical protein